MKTLLAILFVAGSISAATIDLASAYTCRTTCTTFGNQQTCRTHCY